MTTPPSIAPAIAKVKARFRPWRSIYLLVLAVMMATLSRSARTAATSVFSPDTAYRALGHTGTEAVADIAAVAFCLLAYVGEQAGWQARSAGSLSRRSVPHTPPSSAIPYFCSVAWRRS